MRVVHRPHFIRTRRKRKRLFRPGIVLALLGLAAIIDSTVRLGHLGFGRSLWYRDWHQNPGAALESYFGTVSLILGLWLFRYEHKRNNSGPTPETPKSP